jgi:hypothetical protein
MSWVLAAGLCLVVTVGLAVTGGALVAFFFRLVRSAPKAPGPVRPLASLDRSPPQRGSDLMPFLPMNDLHPGLPQLPPNTGWLGLFIDRKPVGPVALVGVCRVPASHELALATMEFVFAHRTTNERVRVAIPWLGGLPASASGLANDLARAKQQGHIVPPYPTLPPMTDDDYSTAVTRYFWLPNAQIPVPPSSEYVVYVEGLTGWLNELPFSFI